MKNVTTSFVLPVYNAEDVVAGTIDSVLAQTDSDFELVIVDDGSTDGTAEILRRYAERDERIRIIRQTNAGITRALIAGCAAARGQYIARQDAGDLSDRRRLEVQTRFFDDPEVVFVSCATQYAGPDLEPLWVTKPTGKALEPANVLDLTRRPVMIDGPTHHGSVVFRRDTYEACGGYRRDFYYAQDFDLWYRLAERGKFRTTNEILYTARVTPDSLSGAGRRPQEALATLSIRALEARQRGESEEAVLASASQVKRASGQRRSSAEGFYFIGEALRRNRDERAMRYLRRSAMLSPLSPKHWFRLAQTGLSFLHRKAGLKYRYDRAQSYRRRFGSRAALRIHHQIWDSARAPREVRVPGIRTPVTLRSGTADASTFEHIFVWNGYDLPYPTNVKSIIDAGANIGLASVFFANRFPEARIIALEPEAGNFELLEKNVRPYSNVIPIHAALWTHDAMIGLANPDDRVDSYRFDSGATAHSIQAFSVSSLLKRFELSSLDLLKIDIEGGETAIFSQYEPWMSRIRAFVIELHGDAARANFDRATSKLRGRRSQHGENTLFVPDTE
ncbi:MAG TPA: FkbM family methyltransferase [Thermoanaerobaculia bacterium]|jgi:FkbM family methyltransferase|nr:FkbM family methyltransferase [Thermoanaerobaculia bacterium]